MAAANVAEGVANTAIDAPVGGIVEICGLTVVLLPDLQRPAPVPGSVESAVRP